MKTVTSSAVTSSSIRNRNRAVGAPVHVPSPSDAPRTGQQSPWEIGLGFYDQRDSYTRNARIDDAGYGNGPSVHPEDGSYAYLRDLPPRSRSSTPESPEPDEGATPGRSFYAREAWPWLHHHPDAGAGLLEPTRRRGFWRRLTGGVREVLLRVAHPERSIDLREDRRIERDIAQAFEIREDLDSTDIEIHVRREEVVLEGTVNDQRERRLAGETASGIRGVRAVHNRLQIRSNDPTDANVVMVLPVSLLAF